MRRLKLINLLLVKVVMPIGDIITGTSVMKHLKYWQNIFSRSENEIDIISASKLYKLLEFSTKNIPYYTKYLQYKNVDPYKWIKTFPVIHKKDYNNNIDLFLSKPKSKLILSSTSGSSGEQGHVYKDKQDISNTRALILLIWGWAGFIPGKHILQTGMTEKRGFVKSLKDIFLRTKYYIAFGLSDTEIEKLLTKQIGKKNWHLAGYASSLFLLADVCCKKRIVNVQFDKAISLGDKMFPHYRKRIKEAFNCEVIDTYGCSEGLVIATQKDNEYYYILTPHVYVEILDDFYNEVKEGNIGHVVVTSLDAYSMPIIRYDTGDLAIKLPRDKYPLKRDLQLPILQTIIGRNTDIVKTMSNKYMIVHFFTGIFETIPQIRQFRVIQRNLLSIEIEYIPGDGFNTSFFSIIEKQIHQYLNEPFPIKWTQVKEILPTPSGKPQIIQSYIN